MSFRTKIFELIVDIKKVLGQVSLQCKDRDVTRKTDSNELCAN